MKHWWIPSAVIVGFFVILGIVLKSINSSTPNAQQTKAQVETAMKNLSSPIDNSSINVKNKIATSGAQTPAWGSLSGKIKAAATGLNGTSKAVAKKDDKDKKDKKKKKAKKKKKKKSEPAKVKKPKHTEVAKDETQETSPFQSSTGGILNTAQANAKVKEPKTAEEWFNYLTKPLNRDNLMKFIRFHQANVVNDEVFFATTELMLEKGATDVRKYALIALGSYPSVGSFELIGVALEDESSEELRNLAHSNLRVYLGRQYVNILVTSTQSESSNVRYYAVKDIGLSAQLNINSNPQRDGRGGRGISEISNADLYRGFLGLLQNIANTDSAQNVRIAAQQSYVIINTLTSPQAPLALAN